MFKSLFRGLKNLIFALLVLIAGASVIEVTARSHRLYSSLAGGGAAPFAASPCAVCYQGLPPLAKLSSYHGETGKAILVTTNSLGFRGDEVQIPKSPGVFRIICLGDERTLAPDVELVETFSARLQERLSPGRQVEVINAGMPGYCPLLSLVQMRHHLLGLQPDVVILNLHTSDPDDDQRCRPYARFDERGLPQAIVHPAAGSVGAGIWKQIEREFFVVEVFRKQAGDLVADEILRTPSPENKSDALSSASRHAGNESGVPVQLQQTLEPITQLRTLTEQLGGRFLLALVPSPDQFETRKSKSAQHDEHDSRQLAEVVTEFAREHQISMIEPAVELRETATSDDLFMTSQGQLSPAGHRLYAESLTYAVAMLAGLEPPESAPVVRPVSHTPARTRDPGPSRIPGEPPGHTPPPASIPSQEPQPLPLRSLPRRPRSSTGSN